MGVHVSVSLGEPLSQCMYWCSISGWVGVHVSVSLGEPLSQCMYWCSISGWVGVHVSVSLWVSHCLNVCIGALSQGGWVCMCRYLSG